MEAVAKRKVAVVTDDPERCREGTTVRTALSGAKGKI